jgi:hypothetical protein
VRTNQNPAEKNAKPLPTPKAGAAPKAPEPPDIGRQMTDEEIAAVAGGGLGGTIGGKGLG